LFGELAVRGTAEVQFGINKTVAAMAAFSGCIVFVKLDHMIALGAF
jgi:hypothetical protein